MTIDEMDAHLKSLSDTVKESVDLIRQATARILAMNADWAEVYQLTKQENLTPQESKHIIKQIETIAQKYYNL